MKDCCWKQINIQVFNIHHLLVDKAGHWEWNLEFPLWWNRNSNKIADFHKILSKVGMKIYWNIGSNHTKQRKYEGTIARYRYRNTEANIFQYFVFHNKMMRKCRDKILHLLPSVSCSPYLKTGDNVRVQIMTNFPELSDINLSDSACQWSIFVKNNDLCFPPQCRGAGKRS